MPDATSYAFEGLEAGGTYTFQVTSKALTSSGDELTAAADPVEETMPLPPRIEAPQFVEGMSGEVSVCAVCASGVRMPYHSECGDRPRSKVSTRMGAPSLKLTYNMLRAYSVERGATKHTLSGVCERGETLVMFHEKYTKVSCRGNTCQARRSRSHIPSVAIEG